MNLLVFRQQKLDHFGLHLGKRLATKPKNVKSAAVCEHCRAHLEETLWMDEFTLINVKFSDSF